MYAKFQPSTMSRSGRKVCGGGVETNYSVNGSEPFKVPEPDKKLGAIQGVICKNQSVLAVYPSLI